LKRRAVMNYRRRFLDDRAVQLRWVDPRLSRVRVAGIVNYLLSRGWRQVPPDRPHTLVFQEPGESEREPLYQWVPESEAGRDFPARVYELLAAVAEVEDRYAGDVLTDVLRHSAATASTSNGPGTTANVEPAPR
jgi:hypothetical protein